MTYCISLQGVKVYGEYLTFHGALAVTEVKSVGTGFISEIHSGHAIFDVEYQAVVFKVFKGEVLDCVVTQVTKVFHIASTLHLDLYVYLSYFG